MMYFTEKSHRELAGQYDLPVFTYLWVWAAARIIASGGQPDALLAIYAYRRTGACSPLKCNTLQALIIRCNRDTICSINLNLTVNFHPTDG